MVDHVEQEAVMTKSKIPASAICLFVLFAVFPVSAPAAVAKPRGCTASRCIDVLTDPRRGEVVGIGIARQPGSQGSHQPTVQKVPHHQPAVQKVPHHRPTVKKKPKRKPVTKNPICTVDELVAFTCIKTKAPPIKPAVAAKPATISTDEVRKVLPRAKIGFQPRAGAVVNVPTLFWSGVDSPITFSLPLLGQKVEVRMTAHFTWNWGDGTSSSTVLAGGSYPNMNVTHTFISPGAYHVSLDLAWMGSAKLGNTPIPILGPTIRSTSSAYVSVATAPTDLTPNE